MIINVLCIMYYVLCIIYYIYFGLPRGVKKLSRGVV